MDECTYDDFSLIDHWCSGDDEAGEALIRRHFDSVCRFFRTKCPQDADDLVQRTFSACVSHRHTLRRESTFRTWLFSLAHNELKQHLRSLSRGGTLVDFSISSMAELMSTPTTRLARKGEQQRMLELLRRLPVDQQALIELYYWEELDVAELSEVFGLAPGATRVRLHRARQRLRAWLDEQPQ